MVNGDEEAGDEENKDDRLNMEQVDEFNQELDDVEINLLMQNAQEHDSDDEMKRER